MKEDYFKKFMKTGKVEDYLKYREVVKKEKNSEKDSRGNIKKY